jgi:hypothetical protein
MVGPRGFARTLTLGVVFTVGVILLLTGCSGTARTIGGSVGNEALYENPNYAPKVDQDGDVAAVTLGTYTFNSSSHKISHAYMAGQPDSPGSVLGGWGAAQDRFSVIDLSYGGLVSGVKTLRLRSTGSTEIVANQLQFSDELYWIAQDTAGNVHFLKLKRLAGPFGARPAETVGVAAGGAACLVLPAALPVGKVWYFYSKGTKVTQSKVVSLSASAQGKNGLMQVQYVGDMNGDRKFSPNWTGPDDRDDEYYEPGKWLYTSKVVANPGGGFTQR